MSYVHAFSCIRTLLFLSFDIKNVWCFSNCPSLPFFLFLTLVASWHLNMNPFYPETLFVPGHLLFLLFILTPLHLTCGSVMRRPSRTSLKTFHYEAFIQNTKSFCQIFLTLTYPLSSRVRVGSHYVASRSRALPDILYPSLSLAFGVYAW